MNIVRNSIRLSCMLAFCLSLPLASFGEDTNADLINAFQSFCFTQTPTFESLDKKAADMGLTIKSENLPKDNMAIHSKTWTAKVDDISYDLSVAEAFGGGGHSIFCGLAQADTDSAVFKNAMIAQFKLGEPASQKTQNNGMRLTSWNYQGGATLMYTDAPTVPKGFIVNYLYTMPAKN